jgi:hypothetical protein
MSRTVLAGIVLGFALFGCSAGGTSDGLVVGSVGTGGVPGGGSGTGGVPILPFGDSGVSNALSAHVESPPGVTVEFITLSCDAACADVLAVAKGGVGEYSYTWEDGSTDPARRVCPTESTRYEVTVTDTGSSTSELPRPRQTVKAPLTARVLQCGDAGVSTDGGPGACGDGFKPGVYDGTFRQTFGPLSGTHEIVLSKSAATATLETVSGRLDNVLTGAGTTASTTWVDGSFFDCTTQRLFLSGVRSEPGAIPLPYTYEATYDPVNDTLLGNWAAAAPPSPGVFPTTALDSGTWDAYWVRP